MHVGTFLKSPIFPRKIQESHNETLDKLVKEMSAMFDLCAPMKGCSLTDSRNLFMEGDLKFKDNFDKKVGNRHTNYTTTWMYLRYIQRVFQIDAHCFLLTDMLLVCKASAKKGLGTLKVRELPGCV